LLYQHWYLCKQYLAYVVKIKPFEAQAFQFAHIQSEITIIITTLIIIGVEYVRFLEEKAIFLGYIAIGLALLQIIAGWAYQLQYTISAIIKNAKKPAAI
jgi:hypothetical protein